MALISKKFLDTVQGNSIDITPLVLLCDLNEETKEYDILDLFSTKAVEVHKNNYSSDRVNAIQAKPILKNISSIKNSVDIESRKLKINTFRFSLYNYYDYVKSLSSSDEYVQTQDENPVASLVGKNIILYYKSEYTREIDISQDAIYFNDNDSCPILFRGIITRANISNDIITLQGEDFTQDVLKKQQIPTTKISNLEETIRNNVIIEDKETPIPMVFGKVDKSPAIVYRTNYSNNQGLKSLGFLHDIYAIGGRYTTSKLWNDFDNSSYMYVKDGDDYLIFQYETSFYDYIGRTYFIESGVESPVIVPELSSSQMQEIYCLGYTYATNAISQLELTTLNALEGTISEDISINPDYSPLLANYGIKRGWYRQGEIVNQITDADSFNFGQMTFGTNTGLGKGRWILVQLDKKEVLQGFRCYSRLVYDQNNVGSDAGGENNLDAWRLYIKPFNPEQVKALLDSSLNDKQITQILIGDDDLPASYIADSDSDMVFDIVGDTAQKLDPDEAQDIRDNLGFFESVEGQSYSYNLIGESGIPQTKVKRDYDNSTPCDRILIWESYGAWGNPTQELKCGGYMHSFSAKYLKKIEDYTSANFHASITGRKDYASTENINDIEELLQEVESLWTQTITGEDGLEPDYEGVLNAWDDYFREKYTFPESDEYFNIHGAGADINLGFYTKAQWQRYATVGDSPEIEFYDYGVVSKDFGEHGGNYTIPDFSETGLDDSNFMTSNQIVSVALHGIMKKYHALVIMNSVFRVIDRLVDEGWEQLLLNPETISSDFSIANWVGIDPYGSVSDFVSWLTGNNVGFDYTLIHNYMQEEIDKFGGAGYRRTLIKRVLQYVYQNEIVIENTDSCFQDNGSNSFNYEWNSDLLNIYEGGDVSLDGWIQHFEAFMNDTVEVALWSGENSPIWLKLSAILGEAGTIQQAEWGQYYMDVYNSQFNELKSWNDDPSLVGEQMQFLSDTLPEEYQWLLYYDEYMGKAIITKLYEHINIDSLEIEAFSGVGSNFTTSGIVDKPIDIIINILSKELKYGLSNNGFPSVEYYKQELIQKNRDFYGSWQMGFCIDKAVDADKLISDLCKETQSFFTFKADGSFDLVTIKDTYTYEDIEYTIQEEDILKYKFDKTKREDVITSCNYFYRYDNGQNTYTMETGVLTASDLIFAGQYYYDGDNYYNLSEGVGYKEKNLRYHSDTATAKKFQQFDLLNNCNQHIIVTLELSLKHLGIEIGNIIHLPLIKGEKVYGIDYSIVSKINGQAIYPAWIVTEVDIKLDKTIIKAYQLHHLSTSHNHEFFFPDDPQKEDAFVNLNEYHPDYEDSNGNLLRNYNYYTGPFDYEHYEYIHDDNLQIPYGDSNSDGVLNVVDIVGLNTLVLTGGYDEKMDMNNDGVCNVQDIVAIVSYILGAELET